jgi:hypothetical protein
VRVRRAVFAGIETAHAFGVADILRRAKLRFATVVVVALAAVASAQSERPRGSSVIIGIVADTDLHPIPLADVSIGGSSVHVTADSAGRFRITNLPTGRFVLIARRIGFQPGVSAIDIAERDTLWLAFTLDAAAQELAAVVVTERTLSWKLEQFKQRRKLGFGQFFTRADIDKINPIQVVDILRRAMAVRISSGGQTALSARYGCIMPVYLDGIPVPEVRLDYLPPPNEMAAVEVYAGAATMPVWLPTPAGSGKSCGAILFWTKDGS